MGFSQQSCWDRLHLLAGLFLGFLAVGALADVQKHTFIIQAKPVTRLCQKHNVITVNGQFPGPTLHVRNGDTLVMKVINRAQYNATIHWHGIRQFRTAWADGPEYITQCPIRPGGSYTYRFTITYQEGTLWWHAHSSWLRATVYGALIIHPKIGDRYPFQQPHRETPILLGEWWNRNPIDVVNQATRTGAAPNVSDAFTVNGEPGDLYPCSQQGTFKVSIRNQETHMLRLINSGMNTELFFTVADHKMTVVAVDASYTKPFRTKYVMLGPGQTTDVLLRGARHRTGRYYMAARAYSSAQGVAFDNTTTTAILEYESSSSSSSTTTPVTAVMPAYNDTRTATAFSRNLRSLATAEHPVSVPQKLDENLLYTISLGLLPCPAGRTCGGTNNSIFAASMNNVSFVLPTRSSILQAQRTGIKGVFTAGFPDNPPVQFDYTAQNISRALYAPVKGTKVKVLKYNAAVQIVFQGTNIVAGENHPIHLHGYDFYIVGEGFGNYDPRNDPKSFNLVDPPMRNTVAVPVNGWAAIRFVADNPGAWLMHCHLDVHITWGLATVLLVEDGPSYLTRLESPPLDLPHC